MWVARADTSAWSGVEPFMKGDCLKPPGVLDLLIGPSEFLGVDMPVVDERVLTPADNLGESFMEFANPRMRGLSDPLISPLRF
jgi:hypothetical protein